MSQIHSEKFHWTRALLNTLFLKSFLTTNLRSNCVANSFLNVSLDKGPFEQMFSQIFFGHKFVKQLCHKFIFKGFVGQGRFWTHVSQITFDKKFVKQLCPNFIFKLFVWQGHFWTHVSSNHFWPENCETIVSQIDF